MRPLAALSLVAALFSAPLAAQDPQGGSLPADAREQIAGAVAPAPEDLRPGATVLGYSDDHRLITLREGAGDLVCLADDPRDERYSGQTSIPWL